MPEINRHPELPGEGSGEKEANIQWLIEARQGLVDRWNKIYPIWSELTVNDEQDLEEYRKLHDEITSIMDEQFAIERQIIDLRNR